jgi:hypothetical protein
MACVLPTVCALLALKACALLALKACALLALEACVVLEAPVPQTPCFKARQIGPNNA